MSEPLYGDPVYPPPTSAWPPPGPYGPPPLGQRRVALRSAPIVGWLLAGVGTLAVVASFLPWFHVAAAYDSASSGPSDEHGGIVALAPGVALALAGLVIGVRRGELWVSVVALVASAFALFFVLLDLAGYAIFKGFALDGDPVATIRYGLWLMMVALVAGLVLSIVAMVRREAVPPA